MNAQSLFFVHYHGALSSYQFQNFGVLYCECINSPFILYKTCLELLCTVIYNNVNKKNFCLVFNLVLKRSVEICLFAATSLATMRNKVSCIVLKGTKKFCLKIISIFKTFCVEEEVFVSKKTKYILLLKSH